MAVWMLAVWIAYTVKGLAGFGNTLVHTGIMANRLDNAVLTPMDLLLTLPANMGMAYHMRSKLQWRAFLVPSLLMAVFAIPGTWLLKGLDTRVLKGLCGLLIALLGLRMLLVREERCAAHRHTQGLGWLLLMLSGVISGMFGIGALVIPALHLMGMRTDEIKANASVIFLSDNLVRMVLYLAAGLLTWQNVYQALLLCPAMLLGLGTGIKYARYLREDSAQRLVAAVLMLSGLFLIRNWL
ncbi:MAG: sulfite exporter TauE/SafE family protein [Clostridia bacterium]|nr:sulfite exporter TauE/SafE family protein [Clostridia bacterium]